MHFPQDWSWTNSSEFYFHRALLNRRLLRKLAKHALSNFENIHCIAKSMRLKNFRQVSSSAGPISQCYFSHVLCLSLGGWTAISITHTYKDSLSIFPAHSLSPAQHFVKGPREILTQQCFLSSYPSTATLALFLFLFYVCLQYRFPVASFFPLCHIGGWRPLWPHRYFKSQSPSETQSSWLERKTRRHEPKRTQQTNKIKQSRLC